MARAETWSDYAHLLANGRLAQGGAPPPGAWLPFDIVVLAARGYQPALPGYSVVRIPLDDHNPDGTYARPDPLTRARIRQRAREIADRVRRRQRVLVTCHAGRNRSGVLAGIALVELGVAPARVVNIIRELRDGLTNPHLRAMVERHVPGR